MKSCASANYLFDYVIMDEASPVDIVTGALALSCARNAVIVGDLKQLSNVVARDTAEASDKVFEKKDIPCLMLTITGKTASCPQLLNYMKTFPEPY